MSIKNNEVAAKASLIVAQQWGVREKRTWNDATLICK